MTKQKINERVKEHIADRNYGKSGTALSKLANTDNIEIDFKNVEKLANYERHTYALNREAIEIISDKEACNTMEHALIDLN